MTQNTTIDASTETHIDVARKSRIAEWWAAAGLMTAVFLLVAFVLQPADLHTSDFLSFWTGGQLVGGRLYDSAQAQNIQQTVTPAADSKRYIRPPFYAVMLSPFGRMPFRSAYIAWTVTNVAALIVFVCLWRLRITSFLSCALFLPLLFSFGIGQDAPILLAILAISARLIERQHNVVGGCVLSLCAIKPHLFLFVPVVLLAQKRYGALAGVLGGGVALFLVSAAVLGFDWLPVFFRAAMDNEATIVPALPGVAGLLSWLNVPSFVLPILIALSAVAVFGSAREAEWLPSVGYALAAGVVFAPHAMVYDCTLFLPLLLLQVSTSTTAVIGVVLITAVTPVAILAQLLSCTVFCVLRPRAPLPSRMTEHRVT